MKKLFIVLAIAGVFTCFFALGFDQALTLDNLKARQAEFLQWRDRAPAAVSLLFFAFYVAVTALSLRGAVIMTLAAGGLFGLVRGFLVSLHPAAGADISLLSHQYSDGLDPGPDLKHKLGLNKILGTIHTYPTLAEANKYVAGEWKRAHARNGSWPSWNGTMPGKGGSQKSKER